MLPIHSNMTTEFLQTDSERKYMKHEERDPTKLSQKKERRTQEKTQDSLGFTLGKAFDREVAMENTSFEKIREIFTQLSSTELGATTKHLNRAIKYVNNELLLSVVTLILEAGVKPDEKSLENACTRAEASNKAPNECHLVIAQLQAILHPELETVVAEQELTKEEPPAAPIATQKIPPIFSNPRAKL